VITRVRSSQRGTAGRFRELGQDPWVSQLAKRWHIDRALHAPEPYSLVRASDWRVFWGKGKRMPAGA